MSSDIRGESWQKPADVPFSDREFEAAKEELGMLSNASPACNKIHFPKEF